LAPSWQSGYDADKKSGIAGTNIVEEMGSRLQPKIGADEEFHCFLTSTKGNLDGAKKYMHIFRFSSSFETILSLITTNTRIIHQLSVRDL
jgi:hypothetical protein